MEITVTARHMTITDAIRAYACEKVERELGRIPRIESVHVILNVEKYRHLAELVVQAAPHIRVDARNESEDMYASLDGAVEKAARQMHKVRGKIQSHKIGEGLAEAEVALEDAADRQPEGDGQPG